MDIAIRAIFLYAFVILVMRVIGRRELSTISTIDFVVLMVLGDTIQQGLTQDDYSVTGAVIAVATLATMQLASSYLGFRFVALRKILEGEPIVIIQDGKLIEKNIHRERMTADEVAEEMRLQSIASFEDVRWGIIERNGKMSFIPKE
ncbi:MAG TPA: YetF domain-containing protein [Gaiellaceae bacterium]|jgi:uncharacterized membrane protein YcaP (DUF421 family)